MYRVTNILLYDEKYTVPVPLPTRLRIRQRKKINDLDSVFRNMIIDDSKRNVHFGNKDNYFLHTHTTRKSSRTYRLRKLNTFSVQASCPQEEGSALNGEDSSSNGSSKFVKILITLIILPYIS